MNSPCYDPETGRDCPRRKAGCSVGCPDWDKYVEARNKQYEKKWQEQSEMYAVYDIKRKRSEKRQRDAQRKKRYR